MARCVFCVECVKVGVYFKYTSIWRALVLLVYNVVVYIKQYMLELGTRNRALCRRIISSAANGRCAIACLAGEPMLTPLNNAACFWHSPRTVFTLILQYASHQFLAVYRK
jgi:hypothetical protein